MEKIDSKTSIGHVRLKVSDLERAVQFYSKVLGFEVTSRIGDSAAFLSAGGYHHHIGLNTWESKGAKPAPLHNTGL
ncbi:MAG: VOC family protein, partial [archaeon]|nr:VOC family protein [archaeon]